MKLAPGRLAALFAVGMAVISGACSRADLTSPSPSMSPAPAPQLPASSARYRVTFDSMWSAATHPQDFPGLPHFSGLIGGTHTGDIAFWRAGLMATEGMRLMAERGSKGQLQSEVEAAISRGSAQFVLSGGSIDVSPGVVTLEFDVHSTHPLVTLVSMVAPSPDWFVGVYGLVLYEDGVWKNSVSVELFPYDAGTDSGATFSSSDLETKPRQPIAGITGFPFLNTGTVAPLGTFRFERLQ